MKFPAVVLLLMAGLAQAAHIGDVTRPSNERTNVITGLGLVYGLKGTGDGGDFLPAIRMLAAALGKFDNGATVVDLQNVKNVALVSLTATIPETGGRDGDHLDVYVSSIGAAGSLKSGRLFVSPMQFLAGKDKRLLTGFASGAVDLEDPSSPTVGVVKGGCVLDGDFPAGQIRGGAFSFFLDAPSASWTMASNIAKIINDSEDGEPCAAAISEKEIAVRIPPAEQAQPSGFISRLQRLPLPLMSSGARVAINERTGTVVITGDVEISPVVISHKGLTISTILPAPVPTPRTPVVKTTDVVALDTNNAGGAKLQDLMNAMDQLKVPVQDRIDIIKELYVTGKLHAKLITE